MSFENAKENLKKFGEDLKLDLEFDNHYTCILGIDDKFSVHITWEESRDLLYIYGPVLDGLPKDDATLLKLCLELLQGSMLGGKMAGGGVGIALEEELILLHATIPMAAAGPYDLKNFAPVFVKVLEDWRAKCENIRDGISTEQKPSTPISQQIPGRNTGHIKI